MRNIARRFRFVVLGAAMSLAVSVAATARAQSASEAGAPKAAPSPVEFTPEELLKSYLTVRDQLQATQLAIANARSEAEARARTETAAFAEKIEALKTAAEAERERHWKEAQRVNAERERQQMEMARSNRTILWIAAAFGGVGLLAILLVPFLQWRAINRVVEITALRPSSPTAPDRAVALPAESGAGAPSDQAVTQSNQRLMSVVDRMERRIFDLEHTAARPLGSISVRPFNGAPSPSSTTSAEPPRRAIPGKDKDQVALVTLLLGEGRMLIGANKFKEAVSCYDELLKLDAANADALLRKGTALERLNRDPEALQCYNLAIQADRKMTLAYLYKGNVCNRLGRHAEAVESYERAAQAEETTA